MDPVIELKQELSEKGWTIDESQIGKLVFTREDAIITGHQEFVTYTDGENSSESGWASRFWTSMERLDFLLSEIRRFAKADDKRREIPKAKETDPEWIKNIKTRPAAVVVSGEPTIWIRLSDYATLITALEVAEEAIRRYARNEFANDWSRIDYAKYIIAQLQSGEFKIEEEKR